MTTSPRARRARIALVAVFATPLVAQPREWVVDSAAGFGVDFTALQPAFDAVPIGDVVRIRAGVYDLPATLSRGMKVLFEAGARFNPTRTLFQTPNGNDLTVSIPAHQRAVVEGMTLADPRLGSGFRSPRLLVAGSAGHVHLHRCRADSNRADNAALARTSIRGSAFVTVHDCDFRFLEVIGSTVNATETRFSGFTYFGGLPPMLPTPAMNLTSSFLALAHCRVQGGTGETGASVPGTFAIRAVDSNIGITASCVQRGGPMPPAVDVTGSGGSVVIDTNVVTTVTGAITTTRQPVPALDAGDLVVGASSVATLQGPAGEWFVSLLSLPQKPVLFPGLQGGLGVDLQNMLVVAFGALSPAGQAQWSLPIPPLPELRWLLIAQQSITGPSAYLSNTWVRVVKP